MSYRPPPREPDPTFTPAQVHEKVLAALQEQAGDKWVTKSEVEGHVARSLMERGWAPPALDGQISRALDKIVADSANGYVKAKKGSRFVKLVKGPALEDGADMWAEEHEAKDPMFTTVEHRDQCIAAQPLWEAERQARKDYVKSLQGRAGELGVKAEFHVTGSYHYKYPSGHVTISTADFDRLMEAAEKWL